MKKLRRLAHLDVAVGALITVLILLTVGPTHRKRQLQPADMDDDSESGDESHSYSQSQVDGDDDANDDTRDYPPNASYTTPEIVPQTNANGGATLPIPISISTQDEGLAHNTLTALEDADDEALANGDPALPIPVSISHEDEGLADNTITALEDADDEALANGDAAPPIPISISTKDEGPADNTITALEDADDEALAIFEDGEDELLAMLEEAQLVKTMKFPRNLIDFHAKFTQQSPTVASSNNIAGVAQIEPVSAGERASVQVNGDANNANDDTVAKDGEDAETEVVKKDVITSKIPHAPDAPPLDAEKIQEVTIDIEKAKSAVMAALYPDQGKCTVDEEITCANKAGHEAVGNSTTDADADSVDVITAQLDAVSSGDAMDDQMVSMDVSQLQSTFPRDPSNEKQLETTNKVCDAFDRASLTSGEDWQSCGDPDEEDGVGASHSPPS